MMLRTKSSRVAIKIGTTTEKNKVPIPNSTNREITEAMVRMRFLVRFEVLLGGDAEALLFVDDDEAEVGEFDVAPEEAVGADEDVDLARGGAREDGLRLGAAAEAAEDFDGDGKAPHARAEGFVVLLGEDGGGDEDGDLAAVHDGFEGGAHVQSKKLNNIFCNNWPRIGRT